MKIGIDIGGTKMNSVLMAGDKIIRQIKTPIKSKSNKKIMIAQLFDCIDWFLMRVDEKKIKGVGIGAPGPIDFKKQKVLNPPNVTGLKNLFLAKIIREKFKIKTKIENDANCFGLAETILGAGRGKQIVAGLTLGTGVGGFLIVNKKVFRGKSSRATEFGHIAIIKNGRKCSCGHRGCLEAYISARGIIKTAKEFGLRGVTPKKITQLAKKGNKKAINIYKIIGNYLGVGLTNIIKKFKPEIIVIGGGISGAGKFIFEPARKIVKNTKIVKTKLGKNAGAIGAALLFTDYKH